MEDRNLNGWQAYGLTALAGGAASFGLMVWRGLFAGGNSLADVMMILADGFFVVGVLMTCFGCMMWLSGEGMFDMVRYAGKMLVGFALRHSNKKESYRDYKKKMAEKEKPQGNFTALVWVGLGFVALSLVFTWLFFRFYVE